MSRPFLRGLSARFICAAAASLLLAPAATFAQKTRSVEPVLSSDLQSVREGLEKYRDPMLAIRDGFFSTVACVDAPRGATEGGIAYPPGGMGVHFLNLQNIGPVLDPTKPQILIYEPVNGKLVLAAAEWFVPTQVAGDKIPEIFGQKLAGPMDGHEPVMPAALRHYDLHVWLWKKNPRGVFTSTNAAIKCPKGPYSVDLAGGASHKH